MSLTGTPVRTPLKEIAANETWAVGTTPGRCIHRTPKTSPGPALLLALKLSAKKQSRDNPRLSFDDKENSDGKKSGVARFREILSSETCRITNLCNKWDEIISESKLTEHNEDGPNDAVLGDIRTTVGQGRLIMRERFHQFEGLVDNCEFGTSEKPVTCEDLQGFWDMIYFQVEDVNTKFDLLEKCKSCNWDAKVVKKGTNENGNKMKRTVKKKRPVIPKASSASNARKTMQAEKRAEARKRLVAAKAEMKRLKQKNENKENTSILIARKEERVTFDAGFFKVDSPVKSPLERKSTPSAANGTPRGTCLRKQVCTPGSITKILPAVAKNSESASSSKQKAETDNEVKSNAISKKLEFPVALLQQSADEPECVVEVLVTDPPSVATDTSSAQTSTPLTVLSAFVTSQLEGYCIDSNSQQSNSIQLSHPKGTMNVEINPLINPESSSVTLSPPAAFADPEETQKKNMADETELGSNSDRAIICEMTSLSQTTVPTHSNAQLRNGKVLNETYDIQAKEESVDYISEQEGGTLDKDENSPGQTKNQTFEVLECEEEVVAKNVTYIIPAKEEPLNYTPEQERGSLGAYESSPGQAMNQTFEVPKCEGENVVKNGSHKASGMANVVTKRDSSSKSVSVEDPQDMDASNMSILIDEAAKNIEKASEMLKDTPSREVQKIRKPKAVGKLKPTSASDVGTSVTPTAMGSGRDDILLKTLRMVAVQMESLQKLNDIHLQTPSKMKKKEAQMLENMEQLQTEVENLRDENSHLKKSLDAEKSNKSAADEFDTEKIMKYLFNVKDSAEVPDSAYKPHYYRLLAKLKILEAELKAYDEVKPHLVELDDQIKNTWEKLRNRTESIQETSRKLGEREAVLQERANQDNEELSECWRTIQELKGELSSVKERLVASEEERLEALSLLDGLRIEHESLRKEKEGFEAGAAEMKQENFSLDERNMALGEKLKEVSRMYSDEHSRAEALDDKVKHLGQEIDSAFSEFNSNIRQRDEILLSQQKQIEDLTLANTKLSQDCKALQDRIETLEYVEDEMRSLQEQLAETEVSLKESEANLTEKNSVIEQLKKEMDSLLEQIRAEKLQFTNLQEEMDVAKSEAHFIVQQREDELVYGKTRLDEILDKMRELNSTLHVKTMEESHEGSVQVGLDDGEQAGPQQSGSHGSMLKANVLLDKCQQSMVDESGASQTVSDFSREKSPAKDSNSIIWRVDNGVELIQSISKSFTDLEVKFRRDIDSFDFKNCVLQKQLAASKEKLSGLSKEESELEKVLRKRIENLMKESEEKSAKLECNSSTMKMLSDQNLELTKFKIKYEELIANPRTSRRSRSSKRRSSSAGSLKYLP